MWLDGGAPITEAIVTEGGDGQSLESRKRGGAGSGRVRLERDGRFGLRPGRHGHIAGGNSPAWRSTRLRAARWSHRRAGRLSRGATPEDSDCTVPTTSCSSS